MSCSGQQPTLYIFKLVLLGGGSLAAAGLFISLIASFAIARPLWLAALLLGVALGAAAGAAFLMGRFKLEKIEPVPRKTVES